MRNCHYCKKDILCDICDELVNQRILSKFKRNKTRKTK